MKLVYRRLSIILIAAMAISCGDDDGSPSEDGGGGDDPFANPTASYELTFNANFNEDDFPQDYPENARFGPLVAIAHAPDVSVYEIGQLASEAFEMYVEDGDTGTLSTLLTTGAEGEDVTTSVVVGTNANPVGFERISVNVTPTNTRITFLARVAPSPDWFVAVNSFNVIDGDVLLEEADVQLVPLDAGTDGGTTYESGDEETSQAISVIDEAPLGSSSIGASLGSLNIKRTN